MKVLVTGASGFIGSHLIKRLHEAGHFVSATEHVGRVNGDYCDQLLLCDLNEGMDVAACVQLAEPDAVFHLASQAIVGTGDEAPYSTLHTNIVGTMNLLDVLAYQHQNGKKLHRVIVASTDKVYGRHGEKELPYTEKSELRGVKQTYEASKLCEDVIAQLAGNAWGLPISIARFGNVYGGGDYHFSRLVPGTILSLIKGLPISIRSNGLLQRDYIYVDDVVDGYMRIMKHAIESPGIYNFGSEKPHRVMDVVQAIVEEFNPNKSPEIEIAHGALDEIEKQYLDYTNARLRLGWKPSTTFKKGIAETVRWYKENYKEIKDE